VGTGRERVGETTREELELEGDSNSDCESDRQPESLCELVIQPIADVVVIPSLDTLHDYYSMDITNRTQVTDTWECKEALRQVEVQSHELEI
jgi:hypothetical protein